MLVQFEPDWTVVPSYLITTRMRPMEQYGGLEENATWHMSTASCMPSKNTPHHTRSLWVT